MYPPCTGTQTAALPRSRAPEPILLPDFLQLGRGLLCLQKAFLKSQRINVHAPFNPLAKPLFGPEISPEVDSPVLQTCTASPSQPPLRTQQGSVDPCDEDRLRLKEEPRLPPDPATFKNEKPGAPG